MSDYNSLSMTPQTVISNRISTLKERQRKRINFDSRTSQPDWEAALAASKENNLAFTDELKFVQTMMHSLEAQKSTIEESM